MHSTQFHRDAQGVAAPAPLILATPPQRTREEMLRDYDIREAARRALPIHVGLDCEVTSATALLAKCRTWAEEEIAKPGNGQRDMSPYFAGCLQAVLVDVCERLNEAQKRPGQFRARLAFARRMDLELKKQHRVAR